MLLGVAGGFLFGADGTRMNIERMIANGEIACEFDRSDLYARPVVCWNPKEEGE